MIRGIHHVAVSSDDLEATVKFYQEAFGAELVMKSSWDKGSDEIDSIIGMKGSAAKQAMLRLGNAHLEVFQYSAPEGRPLDPDYPASNRGYTHFCVDVTDIDYEYERLTKCGMRFFDKPLPDGGAGIRAVYGRDPWGNLIEIQEVMENSVFDINLDAAKTRS